MIHKEEIIKIAKMTRLTIKEHELDSITADINGVMSYIEMLNNINSDDVDYSNLNHHQKRNVMRDDVVNQQHNTREILANGPEVENNLFVVPPMIERE